MGYIHILDKKPTQIENTNFIRRIYSMMSRNYAISTMDRNFQSSNLNDGYYSVKDYFNSIGYKYTLSDFSNIIKEISDENVFAIIETIFNFTKPKDIGDEGDFKVFLKAVDNYLLIKGYKLVFIEGICKLTPSDLKVDLSEVVEENIKEDLLSYYDFRKQNDKHNKKKILTNLAIILYGEEQSIRKMLGKNTSERINFYSNNFDLRHPNTNDKSKDYKEQVAVLTEKELIEWYDYIYAFFLNVYVNYKKLREVEI